jgi:hypothetical protein
MEITIDTFKDYLKEKGVEDNVVSDDAVIESILFSIDELDESLQEELLEEHPKLKPENEVMTHTICLINNEEAKEKQGISAFFTLIELDDEIIYGDFIYQKID